MEKEKRAADHWTVDKRVPLALIYTVIVQFVLLLVGGVTAWIILNSRVDINTSDIGRLQTYTEEHKIVHTDINTHLDSIKEFAVHMGYVRKDIKHIMTTLQALVIDNAAEKKRNK